MRKAVSMIELILAIVIIGIAVASVPTILAQVTESQETSLKQEGIMLAKSEMARILRYDWDEHSYRDEANRLVILANASNNPQLNDRNGSMLSAVQYRTLITAIPSVAGAFMNPTAVANLKPDTAVPVGTPSWNATPEANGDVSTYDDIDDFDGNVIGVRATSFATTSPTDSMSEKAGNLNNIYRKSASIATTVSYLERSNPVIDYNANNIPNFVFSDKNGTTVSNIKRISITVSGIGKGNVALNAYSANIGEASSIAPRSFD